MKQLLQLLLVLGGMLLGHTAGANAAAIDSYPYVAANYTAEGWQGYLYPSSQGKIQLDYSTAQPVRIELNQGTVALRARLFSMPMSVKPGHRYEVTFKAQSLLPNRLMTFTPYLTSEVVKSVLTADGVSEKILFTGDEVSTTSSAAQTISFTYTPDREQDLYFMLDITTDRSAARTMVFSDFSVTETQLVRKPLPVENLEAECVAGGPMDVTLRWTNPARYLTDEEITISAVKVFRDDALLATLTEPEYIVAGAETTFTDIPDTPGTYTYTVSVLGESGYESDKVLVTTPFIGKIAAFIPPVDFDFSDNIINGFWNLTTAETANGWGFNPTANPPSLSCARDGYKPTNSAATTPRLLLDAEKAYRISYDSQITNKSNEFGYKVILEGYEAESPWSVTIFETDAYKPAANNKYYPVEAIFSPSQSGEATLSFVADMGKLGSSYYNTTLSIANLKVEEIAVLPTIATGLSAETASDGIREVKLSWLTPAQSETGLALSGLKAIIYRDGEVVETVDVEPGLPSEYTDNESNGLSDGYHKYIVVIENANGHTGMTPPEEVKTSYVGGPVELPYVADFDADRLLFDAIEPDADKADGKMFEIKEGKAVLKTGQKDTRDALVAPPVVLEEGKVYRISVETSQSGYSSIDYQLILAPLTDISDMSQVILASSFDKDGSQLRFVARRQGVYCPVLLTLPASYGSSESEYSVTGFTIAEVDETETPLPLVSDFTTEEGRAPWSFLDQSTLNGKTFSFNEDNEIHLKDGSSANGTAMNDWILTPVFTVEDGITYTIEMEAKCSATSDYYMTPYEIWLADGDSHLMLTSGKLVTPAAGATLSAEYTSHTHSFNIDGRVEPQLPAEPELPAEAPQAEEETPAATPGLKFLGLRFGLGKSANQEVKVKSIKLTSDKQVSGVSLIEHDGLAGISPAARVSVYDLTGKLILAASYASLDGAPLTPGLYIINISDNNTTLITKYLKK